MKEGVERGHVEVAPERPFLGDAQQHDGREVLRAALGWEDAYNPRSPLDLAEEPLQPVRGADVGYLMR